jgi:hypothetical protein
MGEFDSFFDDSPPATAQGAVAVAVADSDDDWFARAADGTPTLDERATAPPEAIGAAALSPDRALARRPPRRRCRNASRNAECGGRPARRPVRLVGVGVLALVLLSLALVTRAPHTRGGERSSSTTTATSSAAVGGARPTGAALAAVARTRRRTVAARRAHQRLARRRGQRAATRPQRTMHRRWRSRPVPPGPMAAAPAVPIAVAPPVAPPAAAPVRRRARRPLRAPDPSFTPGDLPPASEAR